MSNYMKCVCAFAFILWAFQFLPKSPEQKAKDALQAQRWKDVHYALQDVEEDLRNAGQSIHEDEVRRHPEGY